MCERLVYLLIFAWLLLDCHLQDGGSQLPVDTLCRNNVFRPNKKCGSNIISDGVYCKHDRNRQSHVRIVLREQRP